jgi:hypothetical protein
MFDNVRVAFRAAAGQGAAMSGSAVVATASGSEALALSGPPSSTSHLKRLEAESIAILREVAAEFRNPVLMYSIGKDSSVLCPSGPLLYLSKGQRSYADRCKRGGPSHNHNRLLRFNNFVDRL